MNGTKTAWILIAAILVISVTGRAAYGADNLFNVTASGGGSSVSVNGSNILDLTDNLINEHQQFAVFNGQGFSGSLRYGQTNGALLFSENSAQTSATLTIPSTGFTRTFTGANSDDLQNQIHDFLKHDALNAFSHFLAVQDRMSPVAVVDGNPQASTAVVATDAFKTFGLASQVASGPGGNGDLRLEASGSSLRAGGFNGTLSNVDFSLDIPFSKNVALTLGTALESADIAGASTYTAGEIIGLSIKPLPAHSHGFSWEITPWAFAALSASYDEAAGTVLAGGGATNSLVWRSGDWSFILANQISYAGDISTSVSDYDFDVPVDQWILKNGGRIVFTPGGGPFFVDAGITYSNFLKSAAVPDYWTPSGGIGLRFGLNSSVRLSYDGDFGHSYHNNGAALMLLLAY